ncbi:uncharacterized protein LOC131667246 [Phymastichus coffea]|uniref:uncharacterized protein LOC131667246 n=1 Tax=Phymastichus coffea TaxID=108790 RepID=UPI00273BB0C9|nr:uncharacterized protein LOC131667246 [Phymastichus coffea]
MNGDDNANKRQIAITRRDELDHPPEVLDQNSRICINCNRMIIEEMNMMDADPGFLRLNVVTQTASQTCIICNNLNEIHRLSLDCRIQVFIKRNIYIPDNVRSCAHHLDNDGLFFNILLLGLQFINRPYIIRGQQLQVFLQGLRNVALDRGTGIDYDKLTDEEFECLSSINKQQFEELLTYCDPVVQNGKLRHVGRTDLLIFLCKMRQGLSDEFLKVIFNQSSRQNVSSIIDYVKSSLLLRFVPENIGPGSITREQFVHQHITEFANELYNPEPAERREIAVIDSTYAYIYKSSNFRMLRQSYSLHKNRHLLKPTLVVAPDGYILTIFGPYFSDARNNDAKILREEFERDADALANWFQNGDIVLVDRGYRDAVPLLQRLGIEHRMPALLQYGQRQLTTVDANDSRTVTKNRWVVEARNGHIRNIFKFLAQTINLEYAKHLNAYYRIAGAIINRYHPVLIMQGADAAQAREIIRRSRMPNVVQARVEVENLVRRNGQWRRLNQEAVVDFPIFDLDYLRDLTIGTYQVNLSPSYVQDKVVRDNDEEFQLDQNINEPGFLRIRLYSRFRNATRHQIFISYAVQDVDNEDRQNDEDTILGYYCTCQSEARTLGTCAYVASVLWYLGYALHQENIRHPDDSLLNTTSDAANRGNQHNEIDIVGE